MMRQHSMTLTARPPRAVSLYLTFHGTEQVGGEGRARGLHTGEPLGEDQVREVDRSEGERAACQEARDRRGVEHRPPRAPARPRPGGQPKGTTGEKRKT